MRYFLKLKTHKDFKVLEEKYDGVELMQFTSDKYKNELLVYKVTKDGIPAIEFRSALSGLCHIIDLKGVKRVSVKAING